MMMQCSSVQQLELDNVVRVADVVDDVLEPDYSQMV